MMSEGTFNEASNNGSVVNPCLGCGQTVRPRQEAIQYKTVFKFATSHM